MLASATNLVPFVLIVSLKLEFFSLNVKFYAHLCYLTSCFDKTGYHCVLVALTQSTAFVLSHYASTLLSGSFILFSESERERGEK
jgi:hypothetical protein